MISITNMIERRLRFASLGFSYKMLTSYCPHGDNVLIINIPRKINIINDSITNYHVVDIGTDCRITKEKLFADEKFQHDAFVAYAHVLDTEPLNTPVMCNNLIIGCISESSKYIRMIKPYQVTKDSDPYSDYGYRSIIPERTIIEIPNIDDVVADVLDMINDYALIVANKEQTTPTLVSTDSLDVIKINFIGTIDRNQSVKLYNEELNRIMRDILLYERGDDKNDKN